MPTTKEAVTTMTDFVNNFSHDNKEFCELMSHEHRYLQVTLQAFLPLNIYLSYLLYVQK